MSARVYRPDHTAHIRHRLAQLAVHGAVGLVIAFCAAGVLAFLGFQAGDGPGWLIGLTWYAVGAVAVLALLTLGVALVGWLVYRRRRADLDAAGAEVIGEFHARMANRRRDDSR
ncbi:hypothetical protein [Actinoplanes sp. NPDC049316]|uniref:hypothetical protein n=1 Tax=Actinoplanes sp. NPDC049316 TaxID=3154727 RepID=UPI0034193363